MIKRLKKHIIGVFNRDINDPNKKSLKDEGYKEEMTKKQINEYYNHTRKEQLINFKNLYFKYSIMRFTSNKIDTQLINEIEFALLKKQIDEKLYLHYRTTVYVNAGQPKKYITDNVIKDLVAQKLSLETSQQRSFDEYIDLKNNRNVLKILKEFDKCRLEKITPNKDLIDKAINTIKHIEGELKFRDFVDELRRKNHMDE